MRQGANRNEGFKVSLARFVVYMRMCNKNESNRRVKKFIRVLLLKLGMKTVL